MLALTENAVQAIEEILSASAVPDGAGLRIAPSASSDGGAAEFQMTLAETPAQTDAVIDEGAARLFMEDSAAQFLDDKLLDAQVVGEQVMFKLGERS